MRVRVAGFHITICGVYGAAYLIFGKLSGDAALQGPTQEMQVRKLGSRGESRASVQ